MSQSGLVPQLRTGATPLIEAGVLGYVLLIPFGPMLPAWLRHTALFAVMAGLVLANLPARRQTPDRVRYQLIAPFVLFAVSGLVSIIASAHPRLSALRFGYAPIAFLFFFAGQHVASHSRSLGRLFLVLTTVVLLLGVDGTWQAITGSSLLGGRPLAAGRAAGSLPHPNDLALVPILLPFAVSTMLSSSRRKWRTLAALALLAGLSAALLSQSRNAWLGIAVGLSAMLVLAGRRKAVLALGATALAGFVLALTFDVGSVRTRVLSLVEWRTEGRIGVWVVAWKMFEEAPLVGKGVHTFGEHYARLLPDLDLPAGYEREERAIPWAHNLYLEALGERGVLGLGALVYVVGSALGGLRRRSSAAEDTAPPPEVAAIGASLLVFLGMGLFDLTFLKDWVRLTFWLLVAVAAQLGADPQRVGSAGE
jgi:O-antigen ligase